MGSQAAADTRGVFGSAMVIAGVVEPLAKKPLKHILERRVHVEQESLATK